MKSRLLILHLLFPILFYACSSLKLQPANFGWPVESVLMVDRNGNVTDDRYSISFNTINVFLEEFGDSTDYINSEIRLLRNNNGFYFLTGEEFKNVYVFIIDDDALVLVNKIFVSESGLINPALNQRPPYIELINGEDIIYLTNKGIYRIKNE